jgi:glucose-6-phosphate isomerase
VDRHARTDALRAARAAVVASRDSGEIGFLDCPDVDTTPFLDFADEVTTGRRFHTQVVIGIGGSSLGARAVLHSAAQTPSGLQTHFAENMDPVTFGRLFDSLDLQRTLFVVVTKSGSTIETMSKFWFAWERMQEVAGDHAARHFLAITDPERGGLRELAGKLGFDTFPVPPNVGGRFSVLTAVGLVPLALAGYPVDRLLDGARSARDHALQDPVADNAVLQSAFDHVALMETGVTQTVMMAYSDLLYPLVEWFAQLWGESLGKARNRDGELVETGLTPVKALGVVDQHSQMQLYVEGPRDKHLVFLEVDSFEREVTIPSVEGLPDSLRHLAGKSMGEIMNAELVGTRRALQEAGRPTSTWLFDSVSPEAVGAFILGWETITAVAAELLDINAFDQPGVELGKKIAHGLLGRQGFEKWSALDGHRAESDPLEVG